MELSQTNAARPQRQPRSHAADAFVVMAMTLTTVALAIGLYLQFRLTFWLAVVAGLSVYVGLLALHAVVRRSERVERLRAEVERLESELQQVTATGRPAGASARPGAAAGTAAPPGGAGAAPRGAAGAPMPPVQGPAGKSPPGSAQPRAMGAPSGVPVRGDTVRETAVAPQPSPVSPSMALPSPGSPSPVLAGPIPPSSPIQHSAADAVGGLAASARPGAVREPAERTLPESAVDAIMNDFWAFRPAQPPRLPETRLPERGPPPSPQAAAEPGSDAKGERIERGVRPPHPLPQSAGMPPPLPPPAASPREADVEMIQGLIKKLADEVNAAEASLLARPAGTQPVPQPALEQSAIETSVSALRAAADHMRASSEPARPANRHEGASAGGRGASRSIAQAAAMPPASTTRRNAPNDRGGLARIETGDRSVSAASLPLPEDGGQSLLTPASSRQASAPQPPAAAAIPPPLPAIPPEPGAEAEARGAAPPLPWLAPAGAADPAVSSQPPSDVAQARLSALAEAITAGRLDVLLDPILGLADHRARHFEVSVRLRDKGGHVIEPPDGVPELKDTGLLPLLDCARMQRSAQVASRLADRGKPGALFSAFSGEALGHDRFLAEFTDAYATREALASQLVLSFAQADVRGFSGRDWETIEEMRELGFRFALQSVTDLDLDFEALKAAGFDFVKLDAAVFLEGMPAAQGSLVPASDICRHLAGLGMSLIVGRIEDEAQLARVFGFGVLLGQGQLFGGARPMKAGALGEAGHAAA